jgi:hypothetical protein
LLINQFASHWNSCYAKVPMKDIVSVAKGEWLPVNMISIKH